MQHRLGSILSLTAILLISLSAVAFAVSPKKGARYVGTIGPGFPVHFRVSKDGKSVDRLVARFTPTCQGVAGGTAKFTFGSRPIHGGKFSGFSVDHLGPTVTLTLAIRGHFGPGGVASGEVTATAQIKSLGKCKQPEPFTAAITAATCRSGGR